MPAYNSKYHVGIDSKGYVLSYNRNGLKFYQKKRAPTFVNKFGGGDSSYRDSTFWQFWASTNWRNGSKQLRLDDPGKFWKSTNVNVNQLDEITLSKAMTLVGQTAAGIKVNDIEPWRNSQSWYNANYSYRQQLTITAPVGVAVPAGYPVKVTIDTAALQTASKVRSDRKDWRVIYFNGSTSVDLTRDYIDATQTWFATQAAISAGASDSSYFVYYGYSGESTDKQPTTEADWNAVYGMFGTTPDANSKAIYHFREGSGTSVNDDTTNSNTGTLVNTPSWGTDGKFGRYATFVTASSHRMSLADLGLGSMTIEGWYYVTSASTLQSIASQSADGGGATEWNLYISGSKLGYNQRNGTVVTGSTTLSSNTWYHLALTHDGATAKIFVNGVQDGSASNSTIADATDTYHIGVRHEATYMDYFGGRMQHIRFSDTARASFPYVLSSEPSLTFGTETTTLAPSSSFETYIGGSNGKLYKYDNSSITEVFDTRRLTWYDDTANNDTNKVVGDTGGTETAQAMSFQLAAGQTVKGIEAYLKKATGTPGDITVRIETNNAGVPSGTLANANLTGTISAFTTSSYGWVSLDFTTSAALSSATTYWLVLKTAAAANDNNYNWASDASSPSYSSGNMAASTDGGSTWSAVAGTDALFRIKGDSTSVNDLMSSSVGGTQKLLIAVGSPTSQVNGEARIYSFDGTTYALEKTFTTATESQVTKLAEYNSKLYAGVGPQARVYEGTNPSTWTLSKDINTPQNPGYIFAMKEYNGRLYVGGGSPEFLPDKHYNGFWYVYDQTTWSSLYPFDFTELRAFEFYDAFLFGATYHGQIYVYDTASLNPIFNFKDDFGFNVSVLAMQLFDDKIYFFLYPQENSNDTNVGIWVFDRHGMSLPYYISGVTGYRCAAVVNNTLYVGTGDDGNVYKLDTNSYATTGHVQTSYFDANLPSIDKLYNEVIIQHDALANGQSVKIYYKFKESDSWTQLTTGVDNSVGQTSQTLSFASGIYSKKISLKVELNGDGTNTPKVKEVVLKYALYPKRKWMWTMRVLAKKNLGLLDKTTESYTADQIRSNLEASQNGYKLVPFVDIDGTSYTCLFSELDHDSWVINQSDINEDEIAITLIES